MTNLAVVLAVPIVVCVFLCSVAHTLSCFHSSSTSADGNKPIVLSSRPCNADFCFQDVEWVNGQRLRQRGCDDADDSKCTRSCSGNVPCLLSYPNDRFRMCCREDNCNRNNIAVIRTFTEEFDFAFSSEMMAFFVISTLLLVYGILPHFFAFHVRRSKLYLMQYEYNVTTDADLLEDDEETAKGRVKELSGDPLDGRLSSENLNLTLHSTIFNKSMSQHLPDASYPDIFYGPAELHLATGFDRANIQRTIQSKYEGLLFRMIENGPGYFSMQPIEMKELFEEVSIVLKAEGPLLELPSDIVIVGDLRGRYCDLLRWLQLHGYPPKRRYLFLGGMIDNSNPDSVETFAFISALKVTMPYDVFMLRGVPESLPFIVERRFPRMIANALEVMVGQMCAALPIAAVVGQKILAVYSGIGTKMTSISSLKRREFPVSMGLGKIAHAALYNVPSTRHPGYEPISGSGGCYFGKKAVTKCMKALGVNLIIRSRNPSPLGYFFFADRQMLTIWSANCHGCEQATTVTVNKYMEIRLHSMKQQASSDVAVLPRVAVATAPVSPAAFVVAEAKAPLPVMTPKETPQPSTNSQAPPTSTNSQAPPMSAKSQPPQPSAKSQQPIENVVSDVTQSD